MRRSARARLLAAAVVLTCLGCPRHEPETAVQDGRTSSDPTGDRSVPAASPAPPAPSPAPPAASSAPTAHPSAASPTAEPTAPEPAGTTGDTSALAPSPSLEGEVQPGDSLSRIATRAGLDVQAAHALAQALGSVTDPSKLALGQRFVLERGDDGELVRFELVLSPVSRATVVRGEDGRLVAAIDETTTKTRTVDLGFSIESSLWEALTRVGLEASLVERVTDVFAYDLDFFTDTRRGDLVRLRVERIEAEGTFVGWGDVVAAQYVGELGTYGAYRWPEHGHGTGAQEPRYVDAEGRGVSRTLLKTPLKFTRVSSAFDPKRMHPVLHRVKGHNGVDYAAPEGTPVWATADGTIVFRGDKGGAGNMVVLAHDGGMRSLYMHLSRFAPGQKVGQTVKAKTVIGLVGQSGLATGPHLHFGLTIGGRYVDPQQVEQHRGRGVPRGSLPAFRRYRARIDAALEALEIATAKPRPPSP